MEHLYLEMDPPRLTNMSYGSPDNIMQHNLGPKAGNPLEWPVFAHCTSKAH